MKNCPLKFLLTLFASLFFHGQAIAQTPLFQSDTTTSNEVEITPPIEVAPAITNQFPSMTNQIPIIKPKPAAKPGGSNMLSTFAGSFGGTYSISGRTLKFPAPAPTRMAETGWSRNLDFGMTMSQGNSDTLRYSLGVDALREVDANTIRLRAHGAYGESDGTKDTENATATLRYERQLTKVIYALGNIDWLTDPIAEIDYRYTGILSPGLRLLRSKTTVLNVELGAGYVEEKKLEDEEGYAVGRAAVTGEKLINDHVLTWITAEYIPKLADPSVFFVNNEVGMASYITRDLSLNVYYQQRYDSAPVEGKTSSDTLLATALSLNF